MTHLLRYLLIFGDRKKKVELSVSQELENVKVETLKQKARELFSLKNVLLQIWDKGFEDWVDLDEGDPTPTNSRIKVEFDKDASSSAAVKPNPPPVTSLPNPKVDSPVVRVLSSHTSSYPPIAVTTTELPIMLPTQKSLPPMSRLTQPQSVPSKQSIRTLPAGGQRQYSGEQPPGSSASARKPLVGAGQVVQDNRNTVKTPECSRGALWSVIECTYLIGIWCSDEIQTALCGITTRRNKVVYTRIALRLSEMGFPIRPWDRVRDKVNRVKTEYRKIKRQLASGYGTDQIAFPSWYVQIDSVYGEKLAAELPDLVDTGDRDDSSSTMMIEDGDNAEDRISEDRISEDDDNYSADSGGYSNRTDKLPTNHDRHKRATRDGIEDEGGRSTISDGESRDSITGAGVTGDGDDDDAWIAEGISEVTGNESGDDALDASTTERKDGTARRGVKRQQNGEVRSKTSDGLSKEDRLEEEEDKGEREGQNHGDERSGSKRYHLRECQVKIEMEEYDET